MFFRRDIAPQLVIVVASEVFNNASRFGGDVLLETVGLQAIDLIDKDLVRLLVEVEGQRLPQRDQQQPCGTAKSSMAMVSMASCG